MNERPLLSCIIPAYNSAKTIERAVYSLIAQGLGDALQIIIADDDSPTPFFHLIQNDFYTFKHNIYVRIPPHEPHCPGYTQRYAMRFVRGKYLMNLDHDDYVMQDSLPYLLEILEDARQKEDIGLLWTKPLWHSADGHIYELTQNVTWTHGKLYDLDFVRKCRINFETWRMYQDLQWNQHYEVHMMCNHTLRLISEESFYVWTDEPTSITHQCPAEHAMNYAEYMYRATKSALNVYMNRYFYNQTMEEKAIAFNYFIDSLTGLYGLLNNAHRIQRVYFVKRLAEDIINAFGITQQKLLQALQSYEIGKIILDERKIYLCTD